VTLRLDTRNRAGVHDIVVRPKGPSAGQSTVFVLLDAALGVHHQGMDQDMDQGMDQGKGRGGVKDGLMGAFQREMLASYTPPAHAALAEDFAAALEATPAGSVRGYLLGRLPPPPPSSSSSSSLSSLRQWGGDRTRLAASFNLAVDALANLRRLHLSVRASSQLFSPQAGGDPSLACQ